MSTTNTDQIANTSSNHNSSITAANVSVPNSDDILIRTLNHADYQATHDAMLGRTLERIELKKTQQQRSADELWVVEHLDVYTLGQAGKQEHILQRNQTPIIKTDRGGQVTWHGRGQLVMYWLFDLNALGWNVRNLVSHAEQAIEDIINQYLRATHPSHPHRTLYAHARQDAPGVYLYSSSTEYPNTDHHQNPQMLGKIASLGFKIKHGFSYHGIAVNIDCDLSAFADINPCGYAGMTMLRLVDFAELNNHTFTQDLLDNIRQRHAGTIPLR